MRFVELLIHSWFLNLDGGLMLASPLNSFFHYFVWVVLVFGIGSWSINLQPDPLQAWLFSKFECLGLSAMEIHLLQNKYERINLCRFGSWHAEWGYDTILLWRPWCLSTFNYDKESWTEGGGIHNFLYQSLQWPPEVACTQTNCTCHISNLHID